MFVETHADQDDDIRNDSDWRWRAAGSRALGESNLAVGFRGRVSYRGGGQYRNVSAWVESLNTILRLSPEYLLPGHTGPLLGAQVVRKAVTAYRDGVQYVLDETLKGMNRGLTPDQLVEQVQLPAHLRDVPQLREYYGKVAWTVRSIFSGYLGWFDGNPANLHALRLADRGYVLETGQIVLEGTSRELLNNQDVQRAYLGKD